MIGMYISSAIMSFILFCTRLYDFFVYPEFHGQAWDRSWILCIAAIFLTFFSTIFCVYMSIKAYKKRVNLNGM